MHVDRKKNSEILTLPLIRLVRHDVQAELRGNNQFINIQIGKSLTNMDVNDCDNHKGI